MDICVSGFSGMVGAEARCGSKNEWVVGRWSLGVHRTQGQKKQQGTGNQIVRTIVAWISTLGMLRERTEREKSGMNIPAPYKAPKRDEVVFPHPVLRE